MATSPLAVNGIAAILKPLRLRSCGVKANAYGEKERLIKLKKISYCFVYSG